MTSKLPGPMSRTGLKKVAFGKPDTGILFWPRLEAGLGRCRGLVDLVSGPTDGL